MKIDTYKTLTYEEDEREKNPNAFALSNGNRKCQHVKISNKEQVKEFLNKYGLSGILDDNINISILWNFPRKKYDEKDMWVCMSGCTYSNEPPFVPKHFVISNNIVTEEDQARAKEIIDLLNGWDGIEVSY